MLLQNDIAQIIVSEELSGELAGERDLRFLYVYDGTARARIGGAGVVLGRDEFCAANSGEAAGYVMEEPGVVGMLRIRYAAAGPYLELRNYDILCNPGGTDGGMERIGALLRDIFGYSMGSDPSGEAMVLAEVYHLLFLLRENCRVRKKETIVESGRVDEAERIARIRSYLAENYHQRITLEDLSRETYFSTAYLSRYIKRNFGKNFSEALNEIRLGHALEELRDRNATITSIAMDNGFATPAAFTRNFREKYGETPSEYRLRFETENAAGEEAAEEKGAPSGRAARIVEARQRENNLRGVNSRELTASVSEARVFTRFWNRMINGGSAHDLMRADMQEHILRVHEELGFEYVRFWDLYSPEMMLYDGSAERGGSSARTGSGPENGGISRAGSSAEHDVITERRYNFLRLDGVIDFLRRHHMRPYIELGSKPNILLRNPWSFLIDERRPRIFRTNEEFADFVDQLLRHYVNRYGVEEVEQWYFEIWQDMKYPETAIYLDEFEAVLRRIKKVSPNIRVGGPGISNENPITFDRVIREWAERSEAPDFITYYAYPYDSREAVFAEGGPSPNNVQRMVGANFLSQLAAENMHVLHQSGFWKQEIHLTEWNSSVSNRNVVNDSAYKGAYVVKSLLAMVGRVDIAGYWFASDLFSEYYDTLHLLNGSGGLISKDGIYKPAFYGISFFNRLEPYLLANDEDSIITANARGSYSIVCHNYRHPLHRYYMTDEDKVRVEEYDRIFDAEKREFHFRIEGVKDGAYQVKTRLIDAAHGSVQDEWVRMGLADNLNDQDIEYLRRICVPHITIETIEVTDGVIDIRSTLAPNAIEHIHIYYLI